MTNQLNSNSASGRSSFQAVADAQNGRTTGFDLMRISLAAAVILYHSWPVCYGDPADIAAWSGPYRPLIMLMLPMFFALSGYLVAGSLERTKGMHRFIGLRAIRIVPALAVETFLCAILLGATLTTLPLAEYFSAREFWGYFLNIIGRVHYTLPGVYHDLPKADIVNVSLWTVPYELECYLALVLLVWVGLTRNRYVFLAAVLIACAVAPYVITPPEMMGRPEGKLLVMCFLCGVVLYKFRDKLPHNFFLMLAALAIALLQFKGQQFAYWGAPFAAYVTAYLGLLKAPEIPVISKGDYSYGLYLFAFPLQQLQVYLFPEHRDWYWNFSFAMITGLIYAAFSWHVVEKPILGRRKEILGVVDRVVEKVQGRFRRTNAKTAECETKQTAL